MFNASNEKMNTDIEKTTEEIIQESLSKALPYATYRKMLDDLAVVGKTTGTDRSESRINYTQLNSRRLKRWDKTFKIPMASVEKIKESDRPFYGWHLRKAGVGTPPQPCL